MPFESKAQQRLFFAKENRGELPEGKAKEWADETPDIKNLPDKKSTKSAASDDPMLIRKEVREASKELHGISKSPSASKPKKLKTLKAKLYAGRKPKRPSKKTASEIADTVLQKTAAIRTEQEQQIQNLYQRGYVDLANRLREEAGY